jgi:RimJ/RimL family protein N-acetyltransferase
MSACQFTHDGGHATMVKCKDYVILSRGLDQAWVLESGHEHGGQDTRTTMLGPILNGETVRLAPPPPDFAEIVLPWLVEPEVSRYVIMYPFSLEQERDFLERVARDPNLVFWVMWVEDQPIGTSAINEIDWRNRHGTTGSMIGVPEFRGRGYGGEAMRLRTRYAFQELGLEKLMSTARADNQRSIRGLKRAGYREVGILRHHVFHDGQWYDYWQGEVLREEWEARQGTTDWGPI